MPPGVLYQGAGPGQVVAVLQSAVDGAHPDVSVPIVGLDCHCYQLFTVDDGITRQHCGIHLGPCPVNRLPGRWPSGVLACSGDLLQDHDSVPGARRHPNMSYIRSSGQSYYKLAFEHPKFATPFSSLLLHYYPCASARL